MLILRILGFWIFLLALISFAVDGTRSLAADELIITSFVAQWNELHSPSLSVFQDLIDKNTPEFINNFIMLNLLSWPCWVILAVIGFFLHWVGRKRSKTSIYIN